MADQKVRDWRRAARASIHSYPEVKQKTKQATNSDLWGPTDAQKSEIAEAAFNDENRALIMKALWKRVAETDEYWMHVYKALDVLEYLLLVDVPGIFNDLRFHSHQLEHLRMYNYAKHKDPKEQENLNGKVRIKSKRLLKLMEDNELLTAERQKLRLIMARLTGVGDTTAPAPPAASGMTTNAVPIEPHNAPHTRSAPPPAVGGGGSAGAENGDGQEFEIDLELLTMMMEMGFDDQDACIQALLAADNNLDRACEYMLANPTGKGSKKPSPVQPGAPGNLIALDTPTSSVPTPQPTPASGKTPATDLWSAIESPTSTTVSATTPSNPPAPTSTTSAPSLDLFGGDQPPPAHPAPAPTTSAPGGSLAPSLWAGSPTLTPGQTQTQAQAPTVATASAPKPQPEFDPFADAVKEDLHQPAAGETAGDGNTTAGGASGGAAVGPMDFFAEAKPQRQSPAPLHGPPVVAAPPPPQQQPPNQLDLFGPPPTSTSTVQQPQQPPVDIWGAPTTQQAAPAPAAPPAQPKGPPTTTTAPTAPSNGAGTAKDKKSLESKMMMEFQNLGMGSGPKKNY